jgi:OOP family OmpA-OmpF porin
MKKFNFTVLAALISAPLVTAPLAAQENLEKTWELGIFTDYIQSATSKETNNDWHQMEAGKSLGIDLQKIINESWNARFELARTRYDINNGNGKEYGNRTGVDAIYKLDDSNAYLFAGVKRFNNVKSYNAIDIGAGYSADINNRLSVYTEAAIYRDVDYGHTDKGIKLGLKYAFGQTSKSQKPQAMNKPKEVVKQAIADTAIMKKETILDNDNDGIVDSLDRCNNTANNVKVDSNGCALYSEETVSINLNIAFENNSSQLKPAMVNDIQRLADFMKTYENTNVVIEGHSSATGSAKYNLMLSQKRADAVKSTLINEFNIDKSRLTAEGFGQKQLLSTGNTKADHNLNRRVVAKIETIEKKVITK